MDRFILHKKNQFFLSMTRYLKKKNQNMDIWLSNRKKITFKISTQLSSPFINNIYYNIYIIFIYFT